MKLKGAEALMKYAERPSGGGGAPLSGDFLMPLVFFGMLMKDDTIPGDLKAQLKSMFPQFVEKEKASAIVDRDTSLSRPASHENPIQIAKLRRAKGEITIEEYEKIVGVLEDSGSRQK